MANAQLEEVRVDHGWWAEHRHNYLGIYGTERAVKRAVERKKSGG